MSAPLIAMSGRCREQSLKLQIKAVASPGFEPTLCPRIALRLRCSDASPIGALVPEGPKHLRKRASGQTRLRSDVVSFSRSEVGMTEQVLRSPHILDLR